MIFIETERLLLRDWRESDLPTLAEMNGDKTVMRFFLNTLSVDESEDFYNRIRKEIDDYGYGVYAVETKDKKEFIGLIGFHNVSFEVDFAPCVEIMWRLRKEFWNNGYATEGASACLKYGFDNLNFDKVYSFTSILNKPSENVMQKIGMKKVKHFSHPLVDETNPLNEHVLYLKER